MDAEQKDLMLKKSSNLIFSSSKNLPNQKNLIGNFNRRPTMRFIVKPPKPSIARQISLNVGGVQNKKTN